MHKKTRWIAMLLIFCTLLFFSLTEPIPQPQAYHDFADRQKLFGIDNFWNVVSNIPLVLIGALGLYALARGELNHDNPPRHPAYGIFFAAVFLIGPGSAWYHLAPDDHSLIWDRLPMALAFTALSAALLAEFLRREALKYLLYPLLLAGLASVFYWYFTEQAGRGDLRPYALVQFAPLLAIPLLALTHDSRFDRSADLLAATLWYTLAKVAEHFDATIHDALGAVGGHPIKHLLAATAIFWLLRMLRLRRERC